MRVIKQLRDCIFQSRKKMRSLVYDKKGNWKKGLDSRDKRAYIRMQFQLSRIMLNNGEGRYLEPLEIQGFKKKFDMDLEDKYAKSDTRETEARL